MNDEDIYVKNLLGNLEKNRFRVNSTSDYPLKNEYMWYKMILESFKDQTNKDDCLGYFIHQFKIRSDVYDQQFFFKLCKEHTISLKKAFEVILTNNSQLPAFPTSIIEQVYQCEFVFGYDISIEWAIFGEKILLIEVKDFDNIIKALESLITDCKHDDVSDVDFINSKKLKYSSFKLKNYQKKLSNLTDFKNSLKEKNLIHQDTSLAVFRKIFSGKVIEERVIWTGNSSELYYLVKRLHNDLKLVEYLKQKQWFVAVNCFVDEDGNSYDRSKIRGLETPSTSEKVDSALNTLN